MKGKFGFSPNVLTPFTSTLSHRTQPIFFGGAGENRTLNRKGANLPRYLSTCNPILFGTDGRSRTSDAGLRRPSFYPLNYTRIILCLKRHNLFGLAPCQLLFIGRIWAINLSEYLSWLSHHQGKTWCNLQVSSLSICLFRAALIHLSQSCILLIVIMETENPRHIDSKLKILDFGTIWCWLGTT